MTRILVAEDSEPVRLLLRKRLQRAGHEVVAVQDGVEVLEHLAATTPDQRPAVVLMDESMPRCTGTEAVRALRARRDPVPVVMVTAHVEPHEQQRAREAGADAVLAKPIDWELLDATIARIAGGP